MKFAGILDNLRKVRAGAVDAYGERREDNRRAFVNWREAQKVDADQKRWGAMEGRKRRGNRVTRDWGRR